MTKKRVIKMLIALGVGLGLTLVARAQTAAIEGDIYALQADGSKTPVANALIELYRIDVKGRYETKSDKKGHFAHIGLPFGRYVIIVSGAGLTPYYEYNVRIPPPGEAVLRRTIEMTPGDGRRPTLEEVQKWVAERGQGGQAPPPLTAEQKKQLEEQMKQYEEQKKKAARDEELIKHFNTANELAKAGKYEDALPEYKAALEASPDHPQLYVVLGRMAEAYHNLGVERFNRKERAQAAEAFNLAIETAQKALSLVPEAKAAEKPTYQGLLCRSLSVVATYLDQKRLDEAVAAHEALMTAQTTPADKARTQLQIAKMYLETVRTSEAVAAYRKVLTLDPNNLDALFGIGQALAQSAEPANISEALKVLKEFVDKAKRDEQRAVQVQQANEMIAAFSAYLEEQKQPKGKKKP